MYEYLVIGLSRSFGDFNGIQYDNLNIHCTRPADESKGQEGQLVEIFKVKFSRVPAGVQLGAVISPVYNRFGKVETVSIIG